MLCVAPRMPLDRVALEQRLLAMHISDLDVLQKLHTYSLTQADSMKQQCKEDKTTTPIIDFYHGLFLQHHQQLSPPSVIAQNDLWQLCQPISASEIEQQHYCCAATQIESDTITCCETNNLLVSRRFELTILLLLYHHAFSSFTASPLNDAMLCTVQDLAHACALHQSVFGTLTSRWFIPALERLGSFLPAHAEAILTAMGVAEDYDRTSDNEDTVLASDADENVQMLRKRRLFSDAYEDEDDKENLRPSSLLAAQKRLVSASKRIAPFTVSTRPRTVRKVKTPTKNEVPVARLVVRETPTKKSRSSSSTSRAATTMTATMQHEGEDTRVVLSTPPRRRLML